MKREKDYTYRSMHDERQYGFFWYSGAWQILRPILVALSVAILVIGIVTTVWNRLYAEFAAPVDENDSGEYVFEVTSGQSLSSVARKLEGTEYCPQCGEKLPEGAEACPACGAEAAWQPQLIRSRTLFKYYCDFAGMGQKIQVGTYTLRKNMSMQEIAEQLSTGDGNPLVRNITLIPGETIEDFAAKLVEMKMLSSSDRFLQLCREGTAFAGYESVSKVLSSVTVADRKYVLEGYLAPNTYEVFVGADEETIIRKLLSQTESEFDEFRAQAARQGMSMDQVLTLASIIEKEAKESDFARVSAVFYNRQSRGMPLQSDVTIHYITGVRRMALTDDDLAIKSPYNTYQVVGLPVGPICNPSPAAIRAALYPDETTIAEGYLFFCAKYPQSGELVFAKTNAEHEENVRVYKQYWEEYDRSRGIGE